MKKSIFNFFFISLVGASNLFSQHPDGPPKPLKVMEKLDANKDGKISKLEVKGPLKGHFPNVDLNKDGFITLEELKKAPHPPIGHKPTPPEKN
jgi:hypothetical protein